MPIGQVSRVRDLIHDPKSVAYPTNDKIDAEISTAENWVLVGVGREDNPPTITEKIYPSYQECVNFRAACTLLFNESDPDGERQSYCKQADDLFQYILTRDPVVASGGGSSNRLGHIKHKDSSISGKFYRGRRYGFVPPSGGSGI